ncbi:indolepyruvate ferredoxin oxidoreductase family protein [Filomicrobium sp.]|uniref:indolepyruvate ferredoxin oxidoreductase family protein n=1 Tax=Filomicrobium sp. TaxID=2024831 RepID=UPI002585AF3A|nr:indolepyruvate ferredoxin oxidoreductase family protein [Filomicrobium sp.]MCV0368989.1 indolepyruvate ferredoxin oxidoreductase family protein [Filomicrobium sp.]
MPKNKPTLSEKFDLAETHVLLTGTQAIVRLALMQKARDQENGLNTAGYVTGYRGSPIATIEQAFAAAGQIVPANDIVFQPSINEDLAATAIWGSQQAELRGEGLFDGVFSIWYGKGPGVDRSGDALRHANHAGTSANGGVIALMGDDHTCESSTSAHQSEFAFVDAMIPILAPANVQEILDFGLFGFALSRYAGVWVGLKCVKDNAESTACVDGRPNRVVIRHPAPTEFDMPPDGLNIRLGDSPLAKEARLHELKLDAVRAFVRTNGLDRIIFEGGPAPRIGIVTAGKSYPEVRQALHDLDIDETRAEELGVALYKVAMTWPLEPKAMLRFAADLDLIIVVEEKRALIEPQIKELLYGRDARPVIIGKRDEDGAPLFKSSGALETLQIALAIGERLSERTGDRQIWNRVAELHRFATNRATEPEAFERTAYFCAGCPHNTSTQVPDGARAYAGIGCHYMAQWMDRATDGFTQMGAEGANWIGEAPFSARDHVFQNIGDGTFVHSGSLAIRAAVVSGTNITFKVLYNDAVAMTGGQPLEGGMTVSQMAALALAEGVARVDVVTDDPARYRSINLPPGVELLQRSKLDATQRALAETRGVSVLIYDQTCAAEKRRRRKRGTLQDPDRRVFINPLVCEGCGDCGVKSNCVAIVPLETELGRKRAIDQSACNNDFTCLEGFCPSFVTLHGAKPKSRSSSETKQTATPTLNPVALPEPQRPSLAEPYAILATGIGGTGVVTISAVLGQAAHLAGLGFGAIDATGLAQKGGAVVCHMRFAAEPEAINAIRVGTADADLILGGDLVVTASNKVLDCIYPNHTAVAVSSHEVLTGAFTRRPDLAIPSHRLMDRIRRRLNGAPLISVDVYDLAVRNFGDSIYANMMLLGIAYQHGFIPVPSNCIEAAIRLNGAKAETNIAAFRFGRTTATRDELQTEHEDPNPAHKALTLREAIAHRAAHLEAYQNVTLAERYLERVDAIANLEQHRIPGSQTLTKAVAHAYFNVLAIKDEYEVARLFTQGSFQNLIGQNFDNIRAMTFHMAPPLLPRRDRATGHPRKLAISGRWLMPILKGLAKAKRLRGTWADPFAYTVDRRRERAWITQYEEDLDLIAQRLNHGNYAAAIELAGLPQTVRGFGHVKMAALDKAEHRAKELRQQLRDRSRSANLDRIPAQ